MHQIVSSLRAQLAAASQSLEERHQAIKELRQLRDRDAKEIELKSQEVAIARTEVAKLAAEVERLRRLIEDASEGVRDTRVGREYDDPRVRDIGISDLSTVREVTNEDQDDEDDRLHHEQQPHSGQRRYSPPSQDDGYGTEETELDEDEDPPVQIEVCEATLEYTVGEQTQAAVEKDSIMGTAGRPRSGSTIRSSSRMSSRAPSPRFVQPTVPLEPMFRRAPSRMSNPAPRPQDDDVASTSSYGRPVPPASRRFLSVSNSPTVDWSPLFTQRPI